MSYLNESEGDLTSESSRLCANGNIAFAKKQWEQALQHYASALLAKPDRQDYLKKKNITKFIIEGMKHEKMADRSL